MQSLPLQKSRSGSGSGSEHAFVQLAQKLLLSPASPSTAIHAAQLCLYSPKEQGSALLLTRLAAPPARPYPFHGRMTVELLQTLKSLCRTRIIEEKQRECDI